VGAHRRTKTNTRWSRRHQSSSRCPCRLLGAVATVRRVSHGSRVWWLRRPLRLPHCDAQRGRLVPLPEGVEVGRDRTGDAGGGRERRRLEDSVPELGADEVEGAAAAAAPGPPLDRGEAPRPSRVPRRAVHEHNRRRRHQQPASRQHQLARIIEANQQRGVDVGGERTTRAPRTPS
jgi:hypothetical protein